MARLDPPLTPAPRNGVSASRVGVGSGPYSSVLHFLKNRFPAVTDWPERLARGDVVGANGLPVRATAACPNGMLLWYWRAPALEHTVPFELELLHQCEQLVVVDKPHFLPVTPGGRHLHQTALVRLQQQLGISTLAPMHRLDLDTAGVLVFMVQIANRNAYQGLFRSHQVNKVYEAVAPWRADVQLPLTVENRLQQPVGAGFMQMQEVPGLPNAQTDIELIGRVGPDSTGSPLAHYRLTPRTGKKHQLRFHMHALGLPIVNDRIYPQLLPQALPDAPPDYSQPLQLLARELSFVDPITGQHRRFVSRRQLLKLRLG